MKPLNIWCFFSILSLFAFSTAIAGDVIMNVSAEITSTTTETVTTHLDFGSIDLDPDPAGDTITINAASGPASPVATGASVITGGTSGLITITSSVVMHVDVTYPATNVTLTSGSNTLTLTPANIISNSMYPDSGPGTDTDGSNALLIHVGGVIVIPQGQASGTYTGSMTITINYS